MVVEEGQQNFQTIDDAMLWLGRFGKKPIYNDDGLVVIADLTGENSNQKFVAIDVWQILVGGKNLSPYQEEGATAEAVESAREYLGDQFEAYKKINLRKHYIWGHKPVKLPGSQNSRITVMNIKNDT